eukprot:COSAG06_NODE_3671_length_5036_cov_3.267977_2_plen_158_part_00
MQESEGKNSAESYAKALAKKAHPNKPVLIAFGYKKSVGKKVGRSGQRCDAIVIAQESKWITDLVQEKHILGARTYNCAGSAHGAKGGAILDVNDVFSDRPIEHTSRNQVFSVLFGDKTPQDGLASWLTENMKGQHLTMYSAVEQSELDGAQERWRNQ